MIKLIYAKAIADPEVFSKVLAEKGILVIGISTVESKEGSETYIFVENKISEEDKILIDEEMRKDNGKAPLDDPSPVKEEEIVLDEPRTL